MRKMYLLPTVFFGILSYGQVGVNNVTPKSTVDMTSKTTDGSASEGLIIPRVTGNQLKAAETAGVYSDDQDATLVYVKAEPDPVNRTGQVEGMDEPGFYYFNSGSNRWVKMVSRGANTAALTQLLCSAATHVGVLEATSPASGVSVTVPYNGGNGGVYSGVIVPSIGATGVDAVLSSGTLNNGSGTLTFIITGTPSAAGTATFNIDLGGENCGFNLTVQPSSTFTDVVDVIINGSTRQMMTRNLGADPTLDPNVPSQAIMGSYYQWGRKDPIATAYTPSSAISGYNTSAAPNNSWNSGTSSAPVKTANDPCPAGFRVPTQSDWSGFRNASTGSTIGTWTTETLGGGNYFTAAKVFNNNGNTLTFPAGGQRNGTSGILQARAKIGYYWGSGYSGSNTHADGMLFYDDTGSASLVTGSLRAAGYLIRCISQ
jgi:uncharacterized protein (TIGR02145 family)